MFTFTEAELLDSRLSHTRFTELVNQPTTHIHEIKLTTNLYGEWLFITLSAHIPTLMWGGAAKRQLRHITFWGMGYHESRERWECDDWRWHEAQLFGDALRTQRLSKPRVWLEINERRTFCLAEAKAEPPPSAHANAFAFLADLTDEDGVTTELEDLEALGFDVEGLFDE